MTEGKMTEQDRARLEAWHMQEIDTALDTPDLAAPMDAITQAESYDLDALTAYIAGDVAEKAGQGMTEAQWYSSPNRLLHGVLTMEGISPDDAPERIRAAAEALKAHNLWPWG